RLDANHITMVPEDSFEGLGQLRHLWLDDNSLTEVPVGPLSNLPYLQALTLALNRISNIPDRAFANLSSLVVLHLYDNPLSFVGSSAFQNLSELHSLVVRGAGMVQWFPNLTGTVNLESMDLSYNEISDLPSFQNCANLEEILPPNFCLNELNSLPTAGLTGLNQLKLAGNLALKGLLAAKDLQKLRALSVPYAYQCCTFGGCDSYLTTNVEDPSKQDDSLKKTGDVIHEDEGEIIQLSVHCTPSPGAFKPCKHLLGSWMIRLTVWFICLVALVFNILVLITTFAPCGAVSSAKLFVGLIAASNLLMGAYTGMLSGLDAASWGRFADYGVWWETGVGCRATGFLAIFSSEASILFLALAAIERSVSVKDILKKGKSCRHRQFQVAAGLVGLFAMVAACLPLFHVGEFSSSPLCLPFPTGETPSLGFTVTLVLLNSVAYLLMAVIYTKLYCSLEKTDVSETPQSSMIKHVAWLIFTNCIFFCPVAFFSFAPLVTAIAISPEIMKSVTLIFFPLPACLNPVLYIFFNPQFKEDWRRLKRCGRRRDGKSVGTGAGGQNGCSAGQDFYYDCDVYAQLQGGNLSVCDCCESYMLAKPMPCKHLVKSHSCPALAVVPCQRADGYWSDCGTQSAQSEYGDEGDSFVSDSSDQVQACGRACFYQSRGFPLVRYSYNIPRIKD
ncbi:UNVERIFIED_CONTAM: hypothetical protein FKN15_045914, partial [Acipenser sinensis]